MEKSNIQKINRKYLANLGFNENDIERVVTLVNQGIKEKLYTKTKVPYHNLKHIERVMIYCLWILNIKNDELKDSKDLLLLASLYHDAGRSKGATNKNHGIVGAQIAHERLKNKVDAKNLDIIELLIKTHATKSDVVDFEDKKFTEQEKKKIQILSDILKDADALDRNRIKLFKFAQCKIEFLRTKEAKEIYSKSSKFLKKYEEATRL